jgi:hypothetical protein
MPKASSVSNRRRSRAATTAAALGGFASLSMALLGPSEPPAGPPRSAVVRRRAAPEPIIGTPLFQWYAEALGQPVHLGVIGSDPELLDVARSRLNGLARRWDARLPGSELRRLHRRTGVAMHTSVDTVLLAEMLARRTPDRPPYLVDVRHSVVGRMDTDPVDTVCLATALGVDLVISDLVDAGAAGVCVRWGATVRVAGAAPQRGGWLTAAVGPPLCLRRGALATVAGRGTSTVPGRGTSTVPGRGTSTVAVVADHGWRAHNLATEAAGLDLDAAIARLTEAGVHAQLTPDAGAPATVGDWASLTVPELR